MSRSSRWAWVWPAVVGALVTVLVVLGLRLAVDDQPAADAESLPRSPASSASSGSAGGPAAEASPTYGVEDARTRLHLQATGLDMVGFGDPQLTVVRTLTDVLGAPDEDEELPCDGHPQEQMRWVRWADLSTVFDGGRFTGYLEGIHVPPGSPPVDLGTASGLSPGDSFDRAEQLYGELALRHQKLPGPGESDIFRFEDPPGQGPMFGVVEGPEQTVITIYAGDLC